MRFLLKVSFSSVSAGLLLVVISATQALAACQAAGQGLDGNAGTAAVRVLFVGRPGMAGPSGSSSSPVQPLGPADGVLVRIVDPQTPEAVVTERLADASGLAEFELAPGRYWALVPWTEQGAGYQGPVVSGVFLPNGLVVQAWGEFEVPGSQRVEVPLTIAVVLA